MRPRSPCSTQASTRARGLNYFSLVPCSFVRCYYRTCNGSEGGAEGVIHFLSFFLSLSPAENKMGRGIHPFCVHCDFLFDSKAAGRRILCHSRATPFNSPKPFFFPFYTPFRLPLPAKFIKPRLLAPPGSKYVYTDRLKKGKEKYFFAFS